MKYGEALKAQAKRQRNQKLNDAIQGKFPDFASFRQAIGRELAARGDNRGPVDASTLSHWLDGRSIPEYKILHAVMAVLGVNKVTDLFPEQSCPGSDRPPRQKRKLENYLR
jgi:hypothetical protein